MAGLEFRENRNGLNTVGSESKLIENSATLTIGDVVDLTSDVVNLVGAGNNMYGVVTGFVTKKGRPIENAVSGEDYDGTYTAGGIGTGTYVAAADNETDKQVKAVVRRFVPGDIYSVLADAAPGTTGTSDEAGGFFDLVAASDTVDESTFHVTTVAQFYSHGPDPVKGGNYVLVEAKETQF